MNSKMVWSSSRRSIQMETRKPWNTIIAKERLVEVVRNSEEKSTKTDGN